MKFGFSYVGLIYLVMLMLPNIIWTKKQPKDFSFGCFLIHSSIVLRS